MGLGFFACGESALGVDLVALNVRQLPGAQFFWFTRM
jgi:hypothetical protein